jgi:hypothetical protein
MKINREIRGQLISLAAILSTGLITGSIRDTEALQVLLENLLSIIKRENEK